MSKKFKKCLRDPTGCLFCELTPPNYWYLASTDGIKAFGPTALSVSMRLTYLGFNKATSQVHPTAKLDVECHYSITTNQTHATISTLTLWSLYILHEIVLDKTFISHPPKLYI